MARSRTEEREKRSKRGRRARRRAPKARRAAAKAGREGARAPRRLRRIAGWTLGAVVLATVAPIALLRWLPPPTTAFMLQSRFADPATGRACERVDYRWVPWRALSSHLPRAILVAEDQRFLQHRGFDTKAIGDAVDEFAAGGRMRGASTVSQQVAKNLFLWPGRSVPRKGLEAWLTAWIELLWPKRRILEVYANVAQFGPCVFGAEAASRRYFGRHAAQMTRAESALLAAVLPAPGRMRVEAPGPFTQERAIDIELEMLRTGTLGYLRGL